MAFEVQKGEAHSSGETGTLLQVYVNDYRMVGIGSRIFFGVMTGNAYIDAKGTYSNLSDGAAFGERTYNTSSTAATAKGQPRTPYRFLYTQPPSRFESLDRHRTKRCILSS